MKLRKGDQVIVLSGKDRGKTGTIVKTLPSLNRAVVEGANLVKRAYKPSAKHPKGGIKEEPRPLHVAKLAIVHPANPKKGSRIGYEFGKDGKKVRVYRQADNKEVKS